MSAKFQDIAADEFIREFEAEEKAKQRKADKEPRRRISDCEAAIEAWAWVMSCTPEQERAVRVLINLTKGSAPDAWVMLSETDAGRLLRDPAGVTDESLKRRWVRGAWKGLIEPLQASTGKQIAERRPGKMVMAHGKEKPQCAQYRSETTQVIADIIRLANRARGKKRTARFRDAALAVHSELPAYRPPLEVVKPKKGKASTAEKKASLVGGNSRAMARLERDVEQLVDTEKRSGTPALLTLSERIKARVVEVTTKAIPETERDKALDALRAQFMDAARAQLAIAREQGTEAVEALRAELHRELETLFADAEEAETAAGNFEPATKISSVKLQNQSNCLDNSVQVKAAPCVACGGEIHPVRLEFDTELCDLCGPPRIKEQPTTFKVSDEIAERSARSLEKQADVIYEEDFTV